VKDPDPGYKGLRQLQQTLPRDYYLDADHYRRELEAIWYRNWLYVCRADEIAAPGDFRVQAIGEQEVIVLRDEQGALQAFHNTCRHRGSQLLGEAAGSLRSGSITCPYHAWSYNLQGELKRIPSRQRPRDFDGVCLSLYRVSVAEWRGFLFINLDSQADASLLACFDQPQALDNWPLETLQPGHELREVVDCNWKIFWENFSECLHCPGVHPELSRLVPLYRQFLMEVKDDPQWQSRLEDDPAFKPGLAENMRTWSEDGALLAEPFPGLSEQELDAGHTYVTILPTAFIVGHADYVRIVSLRPLNAVQTELRVQWLFAPETLADPGFDAEAAAGFARKVILEDSAACALNQRGLAALPHGAGVLMPEEYEVFEFQQWVRRQLGESG
jgi:Rieske 2Fe-2S family protein